MPLALNLLNRSWAPFKVHLKLFTTSCMMMTCLCSWKHHHCRKKQHSRANQVLLSKWYCMSHFTKHLIITENTKPSLPPQALIWSGLIEVHRLVTTNGKCNTGSEHSRSCFLFPVKPVLYGWRENHFKCHILQRCNILQRSWLLWFSVCSLFIF